MTQFDPWLRFTLAALAVWRVTHLLSAEDGPGDILVRMRRALGSSFFGRLIDCFYCLSLWIALPAAFLMSRIPADIVLAWLGLSGAACLLERINTQPVAITTLPSEEQNVLLRPESQK